MGVQIKHGNPVAALKTKTAQRVGETSDARAKLAVGLPDAAVDHRDAVRKESDRAIKYASRGIHGARSPEVRNRLRQ